MHVNIFSDFNIKVSHILKYFLIFAKSIHNKIYLNRTHASFDDPYSNFLIKLNEQLTRNYCGNQFLVSSKNLKVCLLIPFAN